MQVRKSYDERDYFVPRLHAYEQRVLQEIRQEQVTLIDVKEYAVGSPKYEALWAAIEQANRYAWPNHLEFNV